MSTLSASSPTTTTTLNGSILVADLYNNGNVCGASNNSKISSNAGINNNNSSSSISINSDHNRSSMVNFQGNIAPSTQETTAATILKIEENNAIINKGSAKTIDEEYHRQQKYGKQRQLQLESDMETVQTTGLLSQNNQLAAAALSSSSTTPKRERIHHPAAGGVIATGTSTSYLLNGSDSTKKGSTSTIWTSEESILRSVGAVDEDNK